MPEEPSPEVIRILDALQTPEIVGLIPLFGLSLLSSILNIFFIIKKFIIIYKVLLGVEKKTRLIKTY